MNNKLKEKSLFVLIKELISRNSFLFAFVILTGVLSYGFFASQYTYHADCFVPSYYDSTLLISAGRWSAAAIHFFTNWMEYAPFWRTVIMCCLLIISGLIYSVLFQREMKGKINEKIFFPFIMLFISNPLMFGQLTFPNLNIALSFCLVPLSFWFCSPFDNKRSIKNIVVSLILMTIAVDSYESFACVYLVTLFALFLMRELLNVDCDLLTGEYIRSRLKSFFFFVALLAGAIIFDYFISKIICRLLTGTFEFWYKGNSSDTIDWLNPSKSLNTKIKRFICYFLVDYILTPTENLWAFVYDISIIGVLVILILHCFNIFKRNKIKLLKSICSLILTLAYIASSKSLDILLGRPAYVTQMQHLQMFVALSFIIVAQYIYIYIYANHKIIKRSGLILITLLILLQSQCLNNYAVSNQERFNYESKILMSVGEDLSHMTQKPVAFVMENEYHLPNSIINTKSNHPIVKRYKNFTFDFWNKLIPNSFIGKYFNKYFYDSSYSKAINAITLRKDEYSKSDSYIRWAVGKYNSNRNEVKFDKVMEITMGKLGYDIEQYVGNMSMSYDECAAMFEFSAGDKYKIKELDDYIIVMFHTPND